MGNGLRTCGILFMTLLAAFGRGRTAEAFHSGVAGECKECHVYKRGALRGSDASSTCLRCHQAPRGVRKPAGYYVATSDADLRAGMPPSQLTPGGDFGYLKKNYFWTSSGGAGQRESSSGERHGHNIVAIDYGYFADSTLLTAPGGNYPAANFSCVSCHDPHAKIGSPGPYRLLGGIGYAASTAAGVAFTAEPPIAVSPRDYNRSEEATDTRIAYGRGMSEWCANCHIRVQDNASAVANYGHPVGRDARFTMETISNYNAYVKSGDLTGIGDASYTSLVPFEEGTDDISSLAQHAKNNGSYTAGPDYRSNVMCLTCHRAHASGWDNIARWNMKTEFIVYNGVYPGIDNGSPAEYAQGRTAAETQRALYDRPSSLFASRQRGLCNKCHARD